MDGEIADGLDGFYYPLVSLCLTPSLLMPPLRLQRSPSPLVDRTQMVFTATGPIAAAAAIIPPVIVIEGMFTASAASPVSAVSTSLAPVQFNEFIIWQNTDSLCCQKMRKINRITKGHIS